MKFGFFYFILALLTVSSAHAERFVVIMKDRQSFARAQGLAGHVEARLKNLNTLIVNATTSAELTALKASPGVIHVEQEYFHAPPPPVLSRATLVTKTVLTPSQPWGIQAVKAPEAWAVSNKGEGIRVLVVDSGVDATHPAIAPNFEKGRDFTSRWNSNDFSDLTGHGTHVAGTIAGVEDAHGFSGVAPKARILAGRACLPTGCSSAAVLDAINWGIEEKVDVINLSLGSPSSTLAEQTALQKADQAGISVVAASGNFGIAQVFHPAAHPTVIAVGAVDRDLQQAVFSQYGPELSLVAPGVEVVSSIPVDSGRDSTVTVHAASGALKAPAYFFHGTTPKFGAITRPVVDCGKGTPADFSNKDVYGKYVLVSRSKTPFEDQIRNAMRVGAYDVLIYNNEPGQTDSRLFDSENALFASAHLLEQETGLRILKALATEPQLQLTVDTVAASYQETFGTSMATPHVSGVVALVKAANRNLSAAEIKKLIMKTATPLGPNEENRYGAGLVNAETAVKAAMEIKQGK
ncbi:S8 family serine peptidase [Bdellovibrio svalbardensis]|uniref:S8 family serine peptidase n=1 Tax=Bdellovibrio svalbardensis TaxID=2972972 RepID=A0ABT6DIS2_9BACT|nr:S8 family serine peptidase [Bdellovibrio svalbardensis]MDG0816749.1 S8 family serine peptidase [Bdellovibrio svalbardensis]